MSSCLFGNMDAFTNLAATVGVQFQCMSKFGLIPSNQLSISLVKTNMKYVSKTINHVSQCSLHAEVIHDFAIWDNIYVSVTMNNGMYVNWWMILLNHFDAWKELGVSKIKHCSGQVQSIIETSTYWTKLFDKLNLPSLWCNEFDGGTQGSSYSRNFMKLKKLHLLSSIKHLRYKRYALWFE